MVKITVTEAEERRCGHDGNKEASPFEHLPEGCIANVLSFTTPWEACALSSVSSTFRSAAQSDVVWERFLPSDYRHILSRSSAPLIFASKKDLYLHLCQKPLLIDAGKMSFALDKLCGKKCYMLSARFLFIVWGDTPRFWRWTSTPYSRFGEVAELVSVCWLEIRGRMKTCMLSADTLYAAYLVFKDGDGGAHGFQYRQVEASVGIVGEGDAPPPPSRTVCLDTLRLSRPSVNVVISRRLRRMSHRNRYRPRFRVLDEHSPDPMFVNPSGDGIEYPRQRSDGWWEVELGDFFNNGGGDKDREVEMAVYEINSGDWKGSLFLLSFSLCGRFYQVGHFVSFCFSFCVFLSLSFDGLLLMSLAIGEVVSNSTKNMGFEDNVKEGSTAEDTSRVGKTATDEESGDEEGGTLSRYMSESSVAATEDEDDDEDRKIKLGPQCTLKEQLEKDKDDESLRRWKEQLLGSVDINAVGETLEPEVKILSLAIKSAGRSDIVLPIPEGGNPKGLWFTLKEGSRYRLVFTFQVNHNIVSGLKYTNTVWKTGIKVDSSKEMIGTFSPQTETYTHEMPEETTPSGMFARGTYSARSKFVDDDNKCYLEINYTFDIRKDWQ